MACKGSGVRVPSAPPTFPQVRPLSRLFSLVLRLTCPANWAPAGGQFFDSQSWLSRSFLRRIAALAMGSLPRARSGRAGGKRRVPAGDGPVEATLLAGRPARYVQLPTAAAEEGPGS